MRRRAGKRAHGLFGHVVWTVPHQSYDTSHGAEVDDPAFSTFFEVGIAGLHESQIRDGSCVEVALQLLDRKFDDRRQDSGTIECVVHENVDPAVGGHDFVDRSLDLICVADNTERRAAIFDDICNNAFDALGRSRKNCNLGTFSG